MLNDEEPQEEPSIDVDMEEVQDEQKATTQDQEENVDNDDSDNDLELQNDRESSDDELDVEDDEDQELRSNARSTSQVHINVMVVPREPWNHIARSQGCYDLFLNKPLKTNQDTLFLLFDLVEGGAYLRSGS